MTSALMGAGVILCWTVIAAAQSSSLGLAEAPSHDATSSSSGPVSFSRWDVSLDGRVGSPSGSVQVGEKPNAGTRLRLRSDLGIDVSEAVEASLAYHLTSRDAVRFTYLQYFVDGSSTITHPFFYNGPVYGPGHVGGSFDFYRLSLDYERVLHTLANGASVTGRAGLTYVSLDAVVQGNHEDFYRQELPVPIVGLQFTHSLRERLRLTASLAGGGVPRVDSLRQEGGTVYLQQSHADAGVGITYALTAALDVTAGYHFTYFFQHEKSHEDDNRFELIDNSFQVGLRFRF